MNNTQFATALHVLTLLSLEEESRSSAYLAGSIGINPAMVRKTLIALVEAGLVITKEGKGGGSALGKTANKIRLSDIYHAVHQGPLLGKSNHPNPACRVGKQINKQLDHLYTEADNALAKQLSKITLAEFGTRFH